MRFTHSRIETVLFKLAGLGHMTLLKHKRQLYFLLIRLIWQPSGPFNDSWLFVLLVLHADYAYLSSTYVDKDQYEGQYLPGVVG